MDSRTTFMLVLLIVICFIVGIIALYLKHQEEVFDEKIFKSSYCIERDFDKVRKIILSCKTQEQLNTGVNLLNCFKKKHEINEEMCMQKHRELLDILYTKSKNLNKES